MTMHHEYMHAYFVTNGFNLNGWQQHKIIDNWHHDQALKFWSHGPVNNTMGRYFSSNILSTNRLSPIFDYSQYGFKITNSLP